MDIRGATAETIQRGEVPIPAGSQRSVYISELPVCVQRFFRRMMRFKFTISYVSGKNLIMADSLLRKTSSCSRKTAAYMSTVVQSLPATEKQMEGIRQHQEEDECRQAVEYCQSGWPSRQSLTGVMKHYHAVASNLSVQGGLLMRGNRVVVNN